MKPSRRLFLISFLILFLELALIRWIPAYALMASYFSNVVLLGSFLGIGAGLLMARRSSILHLFPFLLAIAVVPVAIITPEVQLSQRETMFFASFNDAPSQKIPSLVFLPLLFVIVAACFAPLAQQLGMLFSTFTPLRAYLLDVCGALIGIAVFTILSFFSTPPVVWFLIVFVAYLLIARRQRTLWRVNVAILCSVVVFSYVSDKHSIWSPYYRLTITPAKGFSWLNANNIVHQFISDYRNREVFYTAPYDAVQHPDYRTILIIGSGTGADVATALGEFPTLERLDAVEIDPQILNIGKSLNPNRPYDDPRVHSYVADGRAFLTNTKNRYDLVIYALPDSLTNVVGASNVRLESFLFTREAFQSVKEHLTEQGLFVLYNYYRQSWLVDRIGLTLYEVFEEVPRVVVFQTTGLPSIFFTSPKAHDLPPDIEPWNGDRSLKVTTDDWPFLYLKSQGIPTLYREFLLAIGLTSVVVIVLVQRKTVQFHLPFFALGAGFALLETKSLATFSLLFGNTWLVNAGVFFGILLSIVTATLFMTVRRRTTNALLLLFLFLGSIALTTIIPPSSFLSLALQARYLVGIAFYFLPVFLANLIFAQQFKDTSHPERALGASTLGMLTGGLLEYLSLVIGFRLLVPLSSVFYVIAFARTPRS